MPDQPSVQGVTGGYLGSPAPDYPELPRALARLLDRFPQFRRRPHAMLAHFPIVFLLSATSFSLLFRFTGNRAFDDTAFYCLGGGVLFTPVALVTGWFTWWLNYESRPLRPVVIKLILSPVLLLVGTAAFVWRYHDPNILARWGDSPSLVYLGLMCALIPLVGIIGACGAELTFPVKPE